MEINSQKKYAVMWASTSNLGDDIQCIAAIEFLKLHSIHEYIFIDREKLKYYDGDPVHLIMNGWFIHDLDAFPPSNKITPIFISFHCANPKLIESNIEYFKKYEPIGCRDITTVNLFEKNGIAAYFTGCLTLCFPKYNGMRTGKLLVDVNNKVSYIPNVNVDLSKMKDFKVVTNQIPDINYKYDIEYRLKHTYKLLELFKTAEYVITPRLHCALPCRAFGTPVKFIHPRFDKDPRFIGLTHILCGSDKLENCKELNDRSLVDERVDLFLRYKL